MSGRACRGRLCRRPNPNRNVPRRGRRIGEPSRIPCPHTCPVTGRYTARLAPRSRRYGRRRSQPRRSRRPLPHRAPPSVDDRNSPRVSFEPCSDRRRSPRLAPPPRRPAVARVPRPRSPAVTAHHHRVLRRLSTCRAASPGVGAPGTTGQQVLDRAAHHSDAPANGDGNGDGDGDGDGPCGSPRSVPTTPTAYRAATAARSMTRRGRTERPTSSPGRPTFLASSAVAESAAPAGEALARPLKKREDQEGHRPVNSRGSPLPGSALPG